MNLPFDCTDDDIRWFVRSQPKINPVHFVPLGHQSMSTDPTVAEVRTDINGWPVKRLPINPI
jgi:hypothetical protein